MQELGEICVLNGDGPLDAGGGVRLQTGYQRRPSFLV